MKKLLVWLLPLLSTSLMGQKFDFNFADSMHLVNGYIPVDFKITPFTGKRYCYTSVVIDADSTLKKVNEECQTTLPDSINFNTHLLVMARFGGDCFMRLRHKVYLDTVSKTMIWKVYNIWGGCRAGGSRAELIMVPKPPEGYAVKVDEVLVENTYPDIE